MRNYERVYAELWAIAQKDQARRVGEIAHAIESGNEAEAKRLLERYPSSFLSRDCRIQDLTLFQIALCKRDAEMCKMMKEFFGAKGQTELEKQFAEIFKNGLEAYEEMQKNTVYDFDTIFQAIIDAPQSEITAALSKQFDNNLSLHRALDEFRQEFTKKSKSERVYNQYHLSKAFEIYNVNIRYSGSNNEERAELFYRQVIGYVQRHMPACYRQAFAQGNYYIAEKQEPLQRTFTFRGSEDSISPDLDQEGEGLGHDWAADDCALEFGTGVMVGIGKTQNMLHAPVGIYYKRMCERKSADLAKITELADSPSPQRCRSV